MRRKIFFIPLLLFVFLFSAIGFVSAQERTRAAGYVTRCLKPVKFYPPSCPFPEDSVDFEQCVQDPPEEGYPAGEKDHTLRVEGEGFPSAEDVFVIGCVPDEDGSYRCTTGDSELDRRLEEEVGFPVQQVQGYTLQLAQNPVRASTSKLSVVLRSVSETSLTQVFFGVYPVESEQIEGRETSVQFSTFPFVEDPESCVAVYWDPEGFVFDAQTLEPVAGAEIRIKDDKGERLPSRPGFSDTVITDVDGSYFFYVQAGKYQLYPSHPEYEFPVSLGDINENYSNQYRCDFENIDIYNDYYVFEEKEGEVTRCDIVLKRRSAKTGADEGLLLDKPDDSMAQEQSAKINMRRLGEYASSNFVLYRFKVSRPDIQVRMYYLNQKGEKVYIGRSRKESDTVWVITVLRSELATAAENSAYLRYEVFDPNERKAGLNFLNLLQRLFEKLISQVQAQQDSDRIPIHLRFIQGYAYDYKGQKLGFAKISLMLRADDREVLSVRADEKGFFYIPPQFIPPFPYYLKITAGDKVYEYDTNSFLDKNRDYLKEEKLDLIRARIKGKPVSFTQDQLMEFENRIVRIQKKSSAPSSLEPEKDIQPKQEFEKDSNSPIISGLVIIIFILIVIGLFILVYFVSFKEKR